MAAGWSAELLIPWHTAPMRDGSGGERTLKLYLARVVGSTGERMAWPAASFERSRFLSDFAREDRRLLGLTGSQYAVLGAIELFWAKCEAATREAIRGIPDGVYRASSFLDDDGIHPGKPVPVAVEVRIEGDEIIVEWRALPTDETAARNLSRFWFFAGQPMRMLARMGLPWVARAAEEGPATSN